MRLGDGVRREPSPDAATYTYAGIGYPDPDTLTQVTDGRSITTYAYDAKVPLTSTLEGTNVTSDSSMNVAQWFDYAPYGSVVATTNTGATNAGRQYIGQFADNSGLNYLNARYYNGAQGQFTTEDPVFWGNQNLSDPQSLNAYSYSNDNPITQKDPTGRFFELDDAAEIFAAAVIAGNIYAGVTLLKDYGDWIDKRFLNTQKATQLETDQAAVKIDKDWTFILSGAAMERSGMEAGGLALHAMEAMGEAVSYSFGGPSKVGSGNGSSILYSSSSAVPNFNQNSILFTTPSGAVVTGGGVLVSPPPHSTNQGTNQKGNSSSGSSGNGNSGAGGSSSGSGSSGSNGSNNGFVPSTSGSAGSLFVCHAAGGC
jgi:RHS repeat-associated protein